MSERAVEALKEVLKVIDRDGFGISVYTEEGKGECGLEIEDWTSGGVDMIHFLDFRKGHVNLFSINDIANKIREIADNFDVDEEIDAYREDKQYREAFSYRESVHDFEEWEEKLKSLSNEVDKVVNKYQDIEEEEFFNISLTLTMQQVLDTVEEEREVEILSAM